MSHPEQVVHVGQQLIGEDTVSAFELLVVAVAQTGQRLHIRPCPGIGFDLFFGNRKKKHLVQAIG